MNMENSEKQKFEEAWREAFHHAELPVADAVWTGIESGINHSEKVRMQQRVVFYQRLAAAMLVFAVVMGGITTFFVSDLFNQQTITQNTVTKNETDTKSVNSNDGNTNSVNAADGKNESTNSSELSAGRDIPNTSKLLMDDFDNAKQSKSNIQGDNTKAYRDETKPLIASTHNRPGISLISISDLLVEPEAIIKGGIRNVTIVRKLPAMPASFMVSRKRENEKQENVWASLGASTGNYSPSISAGSASASRSFVQYQNSGTSNSQSGSSTSSSRGSAFSMGVNMGSRLTNKWIIQGGVSYLTQSINYTSNFAAVNANNQSYAAVADFMNKSSAVAATTPYQINSLNEFVSIPVQAGYLLVDEAFGLQINSGIAADLFMQNTLTDKSGQLSGTTTGTGENSPFRSVSWAGLMATELSYKIGNSYRVSLVPGVRYSLNSIVKSEIATSNPLVWDIGFRCRYIFK
jgi:hypothetical protein